jgi:hypothetical protein
MITTIANAVNVRLNAGQFWELANAEEFDMDVLDPRSGAILSNVMIFPDAALRIDGNLDNDQFQVRADQHGDRFEGVLYADEATEVRLVGN